MAATPDWWVVARRHIPGEGTELRLAFRDLPTHEIWVPLVDPGDAEVERLALLILDPPTPRSSPGKGRAPGSLDRADRRVV